MPKKARQIHLARNVPQQFFNYYQRVSACRSRMRALINEYENAIDDDINAKDPYVDHDYARGLCDQILSAQQGIRRCLKALDNYSARTGYTTDPITSMKIDGKSDIRRQLLYANDTTSQATQQEINIVHVSCRNSSDGHKKLKKTVRFVEAESMSESGRGGKFLEFVTKKVGDFAYKTCQTISPKRLNWHDTYVAMLEAQPSKEKAKGKRLSNEDHYKSRSPTKISKTWHENIWPEAYSFEDVGKGLDQPMIEAAIEGANDSVLEFAGPLIDEVAAFGTSLIDASPYKSDDSRKSEAKFQNVVVFPQKPIVAMPEAGVYSTTEPQGEEGCVLTEIKNSAVPIKGLEPRAMKKLRLPCSMQANMLKGRGPVC